jgi:ribokinase
MTIFNLGSVNADKFYRLPHLVQPGETIAASSTYEGLGGKGTNMSVAASRAGSDVCHVGAVGPDGAWAVERIKGYGVDTLFLSEVQQPTGHAIIMVDDAGENSIVIYPGANHAIPERLVTEALNAAKHGDLVLIQNETCHQVLMAQTAWERGLKVAYAAAPFDADAVQDILPYTDYLILNELEMQQLEDATGKTPSELPLHDVVVTLGARGCAWYDNATGLKTHFAAPKVDVVDTTGAGDTFTGYLIAGLEQGLTMPEAIKRAQIASAIMVTRKGTADVIPTLEEVTAF